MWVIDTDVLVAGLRSRTGASAEIVRAALGEEISICLSVALILEYEAVALRPAHLIASGLSVGQTLKIIDTLVRVAQHVDSHFRWRPQLNDANDEMVLEAAVNGGASAIVTFNRKDYARVTSRFGIEVLSPRQALENLR